MRAVTKRPLLLVLAVLILLDIVFIQTVLSRDDEDPGVRRAATATRTPSNVMPMGVTPLAVAPGDVGSPTPPASPVPPAGTTATDTPTPEAVLTPEAVPTPEADPTPEAVLTPTETPPPKESPTPKDTPTPKDPEPTDDDPPAPTDSEPAIQVDGEQFAAGPFETVSMAGTYVGSSARTILRVQQQQGVDWVDFPLPTTTDESGDFTAHVEIGSLGEHQIRVVDPSADIVSKPVTVVIR